MPLKPRTPLINWANSLTKGLVFDAEFFERGGTSPYDLALKTKGVGSNTPAWISDKYGTALNFNGSASAGPIVAFTTNSQVNTLGNMSAEGYLYSKGSGGGTNGRFMHKKFGATRWKIQMEGANTTMGFDIDCTSTFPSWTWTISNNVWFHLVVTYNDSANANVPSVYINGAPVTVTTVTARTEARIADDANLYVGNYDPATGAKTWNGFIAYGRLWNRILGASEARQLYTNPFRIYM